MPLFHRFAAGRARDAPLCLWTFYMIGSGMIQRHDPDRTASGSPAAQQYETVILELPPELSTALDRLIERDSPEMHRAAAIVAAFRDWAAARGLVASTDEGLRPDELNASNDD